jgi:hypothetical protein
MNQRKPQSGDSAMTTLDKNCHARALIAGRLAMR